MSSRVRIPDLQPVEAFTNAAGEGFHQYLRESSNRFRFGDARYDQYKIWLLEVRKQRKNERNEPTTARTGTQKVLSRNDQKARHRCLQKFFLNEDERLCCRDEDTGAELKVLRNWQLFGVITNVHCGIPHGGQEKTFHILSAQYYGIVRYVVRWILKQYKDRSFF